MPVAVCGNHKVPRGRKWQHGQAKQPAPIRAQVTHARRDKRWRRGDGVALNVCHLCFGAELGYRPCATLWHFFVATISRAEITLHDEPNVFGTVPSHASHTLTHHPRTSIFSLVRIATACIVAVLCDFTWPPTLSLCHNLSLLAFFFFWHDDISLTVIFFVAHFAATHSRSLARGPSPSLTLSQQGQRRVG
jgi:hypothetical protein